MTSFGQCVLKGNNVCHFGVEDLFAGARPPGVTLLSGIVLSNVWDGSCSVSLGVQMIMICRVYVA